MRRKAVLYLLSFFSRRSSGTLPLSVLKIAFTNTTNEFFVRHSKENCALIFVQMTQRLEKTGVSPPNLTIFVRPFFHYSPSLRENRATGSRVRRHVSFIRIRWKTIRSARQINVMRRIVGKDARSKSIFIRSRLFQIEQ